MSWESRVQFVGKSTLRKGSEEVTVSSNMCIDQLIVSWLTGHRRTNSISVTWNFYPRVQK